MANEASILKLIFLEKEGQFSVRKFLAMLSAIIFLGSCVVSLCGGSKLPMEYIMIISGVFVFYFTKNRLSGASTPVDIIPQITENIDKK